VCGLLAHGATIVKEDSLDLAPVLKFFPSPVLSGKKDIVSAGKTAPEKMMHHYFFLDCSFFSC
jgi:hypothetical protein